MTKPFKFEGKKRLAQAEHGLAALRECVDTVITIPNERLLAIVDRSTMQVIDGMHRLQAARVSGRTTIEVTYFDGSALDCLLAAVEANIRHGLPLTLADRRESAKRILADHPEWSDRAIAAKVGLSGKTVGALRRSSADPAVRSAVRIGLDGKVRAVDPDDGRRRAADVLSRYPDASLRQISGLARVSAETARDVRDRLRHEGDPVPCDDASDRGGAGDEFGGARITAVHPVSTGLDQRAPARVQSTRQRPSEVRAIDLEVVLDSLKRDPTLRYNDEGRMMIRWLEARVLRHEEADLVERVPPHQATRVAAVERKVT